MFQMVCDRYKQCGLFVMMTNDELVCLFQRLLVSDIAVVYKLDHCEHLNHFLLKEVVYDAVKEKVR